MSNPDDGKTFEEILSEALAEFGWHLSPAEIPADQTVVRVWNTVSEWWNRQDETTRNILDYVDLAPGLKQSGYFDEWPALERIFQGILYGTNRLTVHNAVACFESAFNRQFITEPSPA
jgi:hypothetical protein